MVYQHALVKESNNILKLLEKISTYIYTNVNQNLTWETEPLISSVIELAGHSILFIIYNALSDADPNNNKKDQREMKWWDQSSMCLETGNVYKQSRAKSSCICISYCDWKAVKVEP